MIPSAMLNKLENRNCRDPTQRQTHKVKLLPDRTGPLLSFAETGVAVQQALRKTKTSRRLGAGACV